MVGPSASLSEGSLSTSHTGLFKPESDSTLRGGDKGFPFTVGVWSFSGGDDGSGLTMREGGAMRRVGAGGSEDGNGDGSLLRGRDASLAEESEDSLLMRFDCSL